MKLKIGKRDPLKEAEEEEVRAREKLEEAARRRMELAERSAPTPVIRASNVEEAVAKAEKAVPAVSETKMTPEQKKHLEALSAVVADLEAYAGAFGDLGPSAAADLDRTLLLGIFGELRLIRQSMEK